MAFGYRDHPVALFHVPGVQFLFTSGTCRVFAVFRGIADNSFSSGVAVQFFLQFGETGKERALEGVRADFYD